MMAAVSPISEEVGGKERISMEVSVAVKRSSQKEMVKRPARRSSDI